jgi:hypothetical protein
MTGRRSGSFLVVLDSAPPGILPSLTVADDPPVVFLRYMHTLALSRSVKAAPLCFVYVGR